MSNRLCQECDGKRFNYELVEVDAFWNCDAADEKQEDDGCVAHLARWDW